MLNGNQGLAGHSDSFRQFEGGVKLGIGSFNLVGFFLFIETKLGLFHLEFQSEKLNCYKIFSPNILEEYPDGCVDEWLYGRMFIEPL